MARPITIRMLDGEVRQPYITKLDNHRYIAMLEPEGALKCEGCTRIEAAKALVAEINRLRKVLGAVAPKGTCQRELERERKKKNCKPKLPKRVEEAA